MTDMTVAVQVYKRTIDQAKALRDQRLASHVGHTPHLSYQGSIGRAPTPVSDAWWAYDQAVDTAFTVFLTSVAQAATPAPLTPTPGAKPCAHQKSTWVAEEGFDDFGAAETQVREVIESLTVDAGPGRFRCTKCGLDMYYTGLWRDYYERGIECSGSDYARRIGFPPNVHPTPLQTPTQMSSEASS